MRLTKKDVIVLALAAVGVIGLVVIFSKVSISKVLMAFNEAAPFPVFMFFFCSFMVMLLFSFRWMMILRAHKHRVPLMHLLKYRIAGYGIGVLTPTAKVGGEPARMMLLKRDGVGMKEAISSVLTDKIVEISTNFTFFMVGLILIILHLGITRNLKIFIFISLVVLGMLIFLFYYQMLRGRFFFAKAYRVLRLHTVKRLAGVEFKVKEFERIMISYHSEHRKNFYGVVFISFLGWFFTFGELYFGYKVIGVPHVSLVQLFITITAIGVAFLIPIPMAVGALEAIQISSFALMGFTSAQAIALSFMVRSLDLFWTVIAVFLISSYGLDVVKIFRKSLVRVDEEITQVKVGEASISIKKKKEIPPMKENRLRVWFRGKKSGLKDYLAKRQERRDKLAFKKSLGPK